LIGAPAIRRYFDPEEQRLEAIIRELPIDSERGLAAVIELDRHKAIQDRLMKEQRLLMMEEYRMREANQVAAADRLKVDIDRLWKEIKYLRSGTPIFGFRRGPLAP
jgi:hypothetical protein